MFSCSYSKLHFCKNIEWNKIANNTTSGIKAEYKKMLVGINFYIIFILLIYLKYLKNINTYKLDMLYDHIFQK